MDMQNVREAEHPQAPLFETVSPETLMRLLEISTRLSSTLHLDDLLLLVMDVATKLTNTQVGSILLVDEMTGQLHFAASTRGAVPEDIIVPLDNSIAGWVVRHGRSLILEDVQSDSRFYATVDKDLQFVTRSMLAVPLTTNKKTLGALEVINKKDDAPYTLQDVALLEALASQSAVAIMNARLFHQSDLLAEIMHELKTPLMAIRSASELMTRPELPQEKMGHLAQMIKRETARLSQMTQDFLDFARLESGRVRLARTPVDLMTIIMDVVHIAESQAADRQITIKTDLEETLPGLHTAHVLLGDGDRLKQVMLNFVSNAIKYNVPNGRITVLVATTPGLVRIAVADTGHGIAEEDIVHLFERFYRVPKAEGSAEGSGMGLAIAKKIVDQHGGRIDVQSTVGQGTTFTISLPLIAREEIPPGD
ncbi:MAG: GAF domain-containing sensor histidine kinase [Anaerolineales bacterium]|nr:GAF domain-containing sensor histidine kinase [Anaerolineales bacterium]